jgi:hypothetical protein
MNLIAINGPWQVITFLNFYLGEDENLRSDDLEFVFYDMSTELEELCRKILFEFNFRRRIFNINELKEINHIEFKTVWIAKLFSRNPKIILNVFKKSDIVLYEEGLHSYIGSHKNHIKDIFKSNQKTINKLLDVYNYLTDLKQSRFIFNSNYDHLALKSHTRRCKKKYLLVDLGNQDPNTIFCNINLTRILERVHGIFDQHLLVPFKYKEKKKVMIIGQYLSRLKLISENHEIIIYKNIINHYLSKDYLVYWKSHPRSNDLENQLKENFRVENFILVNNKMPVELYSSIAPDVEFAGISSTALVYKIYIFNGRAFQIAEVLMDKINTKSIWYDDFREMFELITKAVPFLKIKS